LAVKDFLLGVCQATLFTPDEEVSSSKLLKTLIPKWIERFDADPVLLPHEAGLPREIPRIVLKSRTGAWRCDVASARINILWQRPKSDVSSPSLGSFYSEATELLNNYCRVLECRVDRVAAVVHRYATHEAPGIYLAKHFCKDSWLDKPLNRPENFELHAHKHFMLGGRFEVNSWVRNKTGKLSYQNTQHSVVLVEQDLNTLSEVAESRSFAQDEIAEFFSLVVKEFDAILKFYFPEN
jgi:hypothetical protein